ncbi:hypothetical protein U1Q18_032339 [Sarracenia purpurea var. burkii]
MAKLKVPTINKNVVLSCGFFITNFLRSRLRSRIPPHTAIDRAICTINRRTTSLSSTHILIDLPTEDPAVEDPTVEDPAIGASSYDAGPSSSARAQGESSDTLDLTSLHAMLVAHIALYQQHQEEYQRNRDEYR